MAAPPPRLRYARAPVLSRLPLLGGLLALALALGLGCVAIADGIKNRNKNNVIVVTGSAKQRVSSDYAIWSASIASQQPTPQAAERELAGVTRQIRSFLKREGVFPSETTVAPVSVAALRRKGKVFAYVLGRRFVIRSSRVDAVARVAEESSTLLQSGIPIGAAPVRYLYTDLPSLRPRLLAEAARDAQQRARALVGATGGHLGGLRGVDVGVFQVTSPNSTEVSDYGVYDTSTREKDVTAVVNATFALGGATRTSTPTRRTSSTRASSMRPSGTVRVRSCSARAYTSSRPVRAGAVCTSTTPTRR